MSRDKHREFEIPTRFRRAIVLHLVKNYLYQDAYRTPLLLGIHGPSGEGKTFQCEQLLRELNVKLFLLSGGQFESPDAGQPARLVRTTYLNAGRAMEKGECDLAVVMINDIDTGLGHWGEMVQYTTNRQSVFGELMHLVDYPTDVEGRITKRVPIIITANDLSKLYEPLVRAGRMTAVNWTPTIEEKISMVAGIFPELSIQECASLVASLEAFAQKSSALSLPVAAYSHLRVSLSDDFLWQEIQERGPLSMLDLIRRGVKPKTHIRSDLGEIIEAGKALVRSGQFINHLQRTK
jgi:ATPases of the AAA+ class